MKAGFIGAGKVGFSLGRYFKENGYFVTGYYSRSRKSAEEAADFTGSRYYPGLADLVRDSDTLFLTVPDGAIGKVWDDMLDLPIENKNICHCSGSISSAVFFNAEKRGAYRFSVHPLCAVNDRYHSFRHLGETYFTLEGSAERLEEMKKIFASMGNVVVVIDAEQKVRYHAAAVMVSNQAAALADIGAELLQQCGFSRRDAEKALGPLIAGNAQNIAQRGPTEALTGPVERGDIDTVRNHLSVLDGQARELYVQLSERLVRIAERKHPDRNYEELKKELEENEKHSSRI